MTCWLTSKIYLHLSNNIHIRNHPALEAWQELSLIKSYKFWPGWRSVKVFSQSSDPPNAILKATVPSCTQSTADDSTAHCLGWGWGQMAGDAGGYLWSLWKSTFNHSFCFILLFAHSIHYPDGTAYLLWSKIILIGIIASFLNGSNYF